MPKIKEEAEKLNTTIVNLRKDIKKGQEQVKTIKIKKGEVEN